VFPVGQVVGEDFAFVIIPAMDHHLTGYVNEEQPRIHFNIGPWELDSSTRISAVQGVDESLCPPCKLLRCQHEIYPSANLKSRGSQHVFAR
jgi:hypothetical protein